MIIQIVLIIVGFALLIKGADLLVDGSKVIAKKFNISEIIIGLTIVSMGTSMPELFVSLNSALKGLSDMSMGNVIGSNLNNLLLILGLTATIGTIKFKKETKFFEIPMCLGITLLFWSLCNIGAGLNRNDGMILIIVFILFIIYTIIMAKREQEFSEGNDILEDSLIKNIILIILGIIGLKYGGDFVVDNSEIIAKQLNISEKIISLTIVAIGTSLPELVTSIVAVVKKDSDIAIGNIIGSNIFNIVFIMGVTALVTPINYALEYNLQMILLVISTIFLFLFPYIGKKDEMTRSNGFVYLIIYIVYILLILI